MVTNEQYAILRFYDAVNPKKITQKDLAILQKEYPDLKIGSNESFDYVDTDIINELEKLNYIKKPNTGTGMRIAIDTGYILTDIGISELTKYDDSKIKKEALEKREIEKKWYDTENAKNQFENFKRTRRNSRIALWISIISLILAIIKFFIK